jgi:hypothetical protein
MKVENTAEFVEGFREFARSVGTGNDLLRLHAVEMGTPVGHDSVRAVRRVALAFVPGDGVVFRFDRCGIENFDGSMAGRISSR